MKPETFLRAVRDAGIAVPRPAPPSARARVRARHRGVRLPNDLLGFYRRANGTAFPDGRLLPLGELTSANDLICPDVEDEDGRLPSSWLALTDETAGEAYLVLDLDRRVYLELDPEDPDEHRIVGGTVEDALEWVMNRYGTG